jgi:proteasome lid subunit RPN8/RPN11
MKRKENPMSPSPHVLIDTDVLRQIRQHARSSTKTEVCGVLIGSENENDKQEVKVEACIAGLNASQGGAHVTFTQDTWEHIYKIKDAEYPGHRIVGWYHSHPGFGVFLSDHDTFIHHNFFSSPLQVAWVYDPHSDEEGCFGWRGKRLERLSDIAITDRRGGEVAGESGKSEPVILSAEGDEDSEPKLEISRNSLEPRPEWLRWTVTIASYLSATVLGFALSWFLFPQLIPVPYLLDSKTGQLLGHIDMRTGRIVMDTEALPNLAPGGPSPSAAGQGQGQAPAQATPAAPPRGNENDKGKHGQQ